MRLDEITQRRFYHASTRPLEVGTRIVPRGENLLDDDVEAVLEQHRPADRLARDRAVYMVTDLTGLDSLALVHDHLYLVEPEGVPERHDHAFVNEIWRVFARAEDRGDELTEQERARCARLAQAYWSGQVSRFGPVEPPLIEHLASAAVVVREIPYR